MLAFATEHGISAAEAFERGEEIEGLSPQAVEGYQRREEEDRGEEEGDPAAAQDAGGPLPGLSARRLPMIGRRLRRRPRRAFVEGVYPPHLQGNGGRAASADRFRRSTRPEGCRSPAERMSCRFRA